MSFPNATERLHANFLVLNAISLLISLIRVAIARLDVSSEVAIAVTNSSTRPVTESNTLTFNEPSGFVVQEQESGRKPLSIMWRSSRLEITGASYA